MIKIIILLICFYVLMMSLVLFAQEPDSVDVTFFYKPPKVQTLLSENKSAGKYSIQWDGKNGLRVETASGLLFYAHGCW